MKKLVWGLLIVLSFSGLLWLEADGQTCTTQQRSVTGFAGNNSTLSVMDGIVIDATGFHLRLKNKGANFVPTANYPVTTNWRMTGAAADFNGDGYVDLAEGGRGCDSNNYVPGDTNLAIFISRGADPGNPTRFLFDPAVYVNYLSYLSTYEIMALGAGDFDGDGDADIAALSWSGKLWLFWNRYKEHNDSPGGAPDFDNQPTYVLDLINDGYGEYGSAADHWRWESNIECVDVDGDRDLDLVIGIPSRWAYGRYGEVVIMINNGTGTFSRLPQTINPYPNNASNIYGVCGLAAADFDKDGDVDFYCGSACSNKIYYYENKAGTFTQKNPKTITIPNNHGTCSFLREGDIDSDGDVDMVLGTDGSAGNNVPGGYVYWYKNDGTNTLTQLSIPTNGDQVSSSGDLDSGAIGDFDNDGDLDFFVADGNNSRNCYFFMNDVFPTYVDHGTVWSRNLVNCAFITSDDAIVSATLHVTENKPGQTNIVYYLSNSNDQNGNPLWEGPVTPEVLWTFQNPGDFLRWKAYFTSSNELVTPKVITLNIDYNYITKREYSRTSHAAISVEYDAAHTGEEQVLYSASFEFPKYRGHLRSWDVTTLDLSPNRGSVLKNILAADAQPIADAGALLAARSAATRVVYTAYDQQADGVMNDRLDFSTSQQAILENYLQLGIGSPEVPLLIDFVLGVGRTWKLGDINHSSPKALLPPRGTASMMGAGYDAFKLAQASRRKLIFAGANDGMLHAFDAVTLDEVWAFIPNNLLYKLKFMRVTDPDCGVYLYHHWFVDGTATIQDVYFGGAWHTVLVTGQGPGWGKNHDWYYFALDVTDPLAPRPLWEVTDTYMGETWSVPAVVKIASPNKWVALFGSGYDNDGDPATKIGHYFYCVDIETGAILKSMEIKDNKEPTSPFGIQNTLPGSCATVDVDQDGLADAVYFGDLIGRVWKVDLTGDISGWSPKVIYGDPNMYPIITKPAVYVDGSDKVHVYVGTGGDDRAPNAGEYSFVALIDNATATSVEWYIGPDALATQLGISPLTKKGSFAPGERVWADPIIGDRIIYVATLESSIESLNPCNTLSGVGKIYARYMLGNQYGGTALQSEMGAPLQYLQTEQKVRSAVTLGETQTVQNQGQNLNMRKVFIQSYTQPGGGGPEPPSQVLAQPVVQTGLVIKQWREVYKVFKR